MSYSVFLCKWRGAGQEVGRSCIILEFKGRKIMVIIFVFILYKIYVFSDLKIQNIFYA